MVLDYNARPSFRGQKETSLLPSFTEPPSELTEADNNSAVVIQISAHRKDTTFETLASNQLNIGKGNKY